MNGQEAKQFAAELRTDLPTLDLHGLYPNVALNKLDIFLSEAATNDSAARIIYGIGTGKLSEAVLGYLQQSPLVVTIILQGGSCICVFTT